MRQITFEEFKNLSVGDEVLVRCNHTYQLATVLGLPFYNTDANEPDWEVETSYGFCDQFSLYIENLVPPERIIYLMDEAAAIVERFEDVLDRYDVKIPSPDDEFRDDDNDAKLFGSVYGDLLFDVQSLLIDMMSRRTMGYEVRSHEWSGSF